MSYLLHEISNAEQQIKNKYRLIKFISSNNYKKAQNV